MYNHGIEKKNAFVIQYLLTTMKWWNDRKEISVDGSDKAKKYTYEQLTDELGYDFDQCGFPHKEEEILDPRDLIQRYEEQRVSLNAEIDSVLVGITAKLGGNNDIQ